MSTFKVGDRVGLVVEEMGYEAKYGVIVEIIQSASYKVRYDDGEERTEYEGYMVPEDEARTENDKFKQECQTIEAQTKPLLDNAVALIKQAAKISKDNGHQLSEMYELVGGLRNVIDEVGWSSSAMTADC